MRHTLACFLLIAFMGAVGGALQPLQAQTFGERQSRYQPAAYYRYAEPDDITIQVSVWGAVRNPGVYEIPRDAHLNLLFSAAGGPQIGVRQRADDQTIVVRLVRLTEGGQRRVVYEQTMDDEIVVGTENPALQEGDVLTVRSYVEQGVNWRDVLSIGSSLTTLALTILNAFNVI